MHPSPVVECLESGGGGVFMSMDLDLTRRRTNARRIVCSRIPFSTPTIFSVISMIQFFCNESRAATSRHCFTNSQLLLHLPVFSFFHRSPYSAWRASAAPWKLRGPEPKPKPPCRPSTSPARLRNGLRRSRGIRKVDVDCRLVPKGTSEHLTRAFNYAGRGVRAPEVRGGPYGCVSDR